MASEYMYLGEVPKSVYDAELKAYLKRRNASKAKRVPAQFEYNGKKYTFQKAGSSYQVKHAGERVLKEAKRRDAVGKQTVKLSSIEEMMVKNIYDEASNRGLAVDHVFPVAKGGPANAPWNLKLMQPDVNSAKGAKVGGNWQYEPLIFEQGSVKLNRAALTGLAAAGVAALGPLGTAASAAEFQGRSKLASETQDMMDELQAGVAGVSLAADVASYVPPVAPISEAVSTAADVANIGIDIYRQDPERIQRFAKQQIQEKIVEPITRPIKTAQKLIEDPEEFFQNELKYIGGQIRLGRLPYTR